MNCFLQANMHATDVSVRARQNCAKRTIKLAYCTLQSHSHASEGAPRAAERSGHAFKLCARALISCARERTRSQC